MRIHSDIITYDDIARACLAAGGPVVYTERETEHRSRSRDRAFEVALRGSSNRQPNWGTGPRGYADERAATWGEWGMFIRHLFYVDPDAIIGQYRSAEMFDGFTRARFDTLKPEDQHRQHTWRYRFEGPGMGIMSCKCGAECYRGALL